MASGERYNESADTFSFSLVLLGIAVGDMKHLRRSAGKFFSMTAYITGWRPPIPEGISQHAPELAGLVASMWQPDLRARPSMTDVVAALEGFASLGDFRPPAEVTGTVRDEAGDVDQVLFTEVGADLSIAAPRPAGMIEVENDPQGQRNPYG